MRGAGFLELPKGWIKAKFIFIIVGLNLIGNSGTVSQYMSRRYFKNYYCKAALALLLVSAQAVALGHLDLDGHAQEAACVICISASTFDSANVADSGLILPVAIAPQPFQNRLIVVVTYQASIWFARAPPLVS